MLRLAPILAAVVGAVLACAPAYAQAPAGKPAAASACASCPAAAQPAGAPGAMAPLPGPTAPVITEDQYEPYNNDEEGQPLRILSYLVAPFGYLLEWGVARPLNYLATQTRLAPVLNGDTGQQGQYDTPPMNVPPDPLASVPAVLPDESGQAAEPVAGRAGTSTRSSASVAAAVRAKAPAPAPASAAGDTEDRQPAIR